MQKENIADALILINRMVERGYRFTVIHNPVDKRLNVVSCTNCDNIKHDFPEFNIYLNTGRDKMVERVFNY